MQPDKSADLGILGDEFPEAQLLAPVRRRFLRGTPRVPFRPRQVVLALVAEFLLDRLGDGRGLVAPEPVDLRPGDGLGDSVQERMVGQPSHQRLEPELGVRELLVELELAGLAGRRLVEGQCNNRHGQHHLVLEGKGDGRILHIVHGPADESDRAVEHGEIHPVPRGVAGGQHRLGLLLRAGDHERGAIYVQGDRCVQIHPGSEGPSQRGTGLRGHRQQILASPAHAEIETQGQRPVVLGDRRVRARLCLQARAQVLVPVHSRLDGLLGPLAKLGVRAVEFGENGQDPGGQNVAVLLVDRGDQIDVGGVAVVVAAGAGMGFQAALDQVSVAFQPVAEPLERQGLKALGGNAVGQQARGEQHELSVLHGGLYGVVQQIGWPPVGIELYHRESSGNPSLVAAVLEPYLAGSRGTVGQGNGKGAYGRELDLASLHPRHVRVRHQVGVVALRQALAEPSVPYLGELGLGVRRISGFHTLGVYDFLAVEVRIRGGHAAIDRRQPQAVRPGGIGDHLGADAAHFELHATGGSTHDVELSPVPRAHDVHGAVLESGNQFLGLGTRPAAESGNHLVADRVEVRGVDRVGIGFDHLRNHVKGSLRRRRGSQNLGDLLGEAGSPRRGGGRQRQRGDEVGALDLGSGGGGCRDVLGGIQSALDRDKRGPPRQTLGECACRGNLAGTCEVDNMGSRGVHQLLELCPVGMRSRHGLDVHAVELAQSRLAAVVHVRRELDLERRRGLVVPHEPGTEGGDGSPAQRVGEQHLAIHVLVHGGGIDHQHLDGSAEEAFHAFQCLVARQAVAPALGPVGPGRHRIARPLRSPGFRKRTRGLHTAEQLIRDVLGNVVPHVAVHLAVEQGNIQGAEQGGLQRFPTGDLRGHLGADQRFQRLGPGFNLGDRHQAQLVDPEHARRIVHGLVVFHQFLYRWNGGPLDEAVVVLVAVHACVEVTHLVHFLHKIAPLGVGKLADLIGMLPALGIRGHDLGNSDESAVLDRRARRVLREEPGGTPDEAVHGLPCRVVGSRGPPGRGGEQRGVRARGTEYLGNVADVLSVVGQDPGPGFLHRLPQHLLPVFRGGFRQRCPPVLRILVPDDRPVIVPGQRVVVPGESHVDILFNHAG